jgi:hypothetical protein
MGALVTSGVKGFEHEDPGPNLPFCSLDVFDVE